MRRRVCARAQIIVRCFCGRSWCVAPTRFIYLSVDLSVCLSVSLSIYLSMVFVPSSVPLLSNFPGPHALDPRTATACAGSTRRSRPRFRISCHCDWPPFTLRMEDAATILRGDVQDSRMQLHRQTTGGTNKGRGELACSVGLIYLPRISAMDLMRSSSVLAMISPPKRFESPVPILLRRVTIAVAAKPSTKN